MFKSVASSAAPIHHYPNMSCYDSKSYWESKEYASAIEKITAEEISLLATSLARPIMKTLDLGMELFYGKTFTKKRCNLNSSFMQAAIPFFEEQMRKAFSNGVEFFEKGMEFRVFDAESSGILDQLVSKLNESDREALQMAIQVHLPGVKTVIVCLKISHRHAPPSSEDLNFSFSQFIDGAECYGCSAGFESLKFKLRW